MMSLTDVINAQVYKFQQYGVDKGICHPVVYSVIQDKYGFIWFATGTGLCRYDGFNFSNPSQNLPSTNATCSFKDRDGNLWFGYSDGIVVKYDGIDFSVVDTSLNRTTINQITQSPDGGIFVATQTEGITLIRDGQVTYLKQGFEDKLIYSVQFIDNNQLFVGCDDGLYLYNYQENRAYFELLAKIDPVPETIVRAIIPYRQDGYWVATEDAGIYIIRGKVSIGEVVQVDIADLEGARVQSIIEHEQDLWISTFDKGIIRVRLGEDMQPDRVYNYVADNGLGSSYIKQIFFDDQQNLWVGTYGNGAALLSNLAISFYDHIPSIKNNVTAICAVNDSSQYWVAGDGAIILVNAGNEIPVMIIDQANGLPRGRVTALHVDQAQNLWIGTESNGLYFLAKGGSQVSLKFRTGNSLSNMIQAITSLGDELWLGTRNGVVVINLTTNQIEYINTDKGLPHNNIRGIFKDSHNNIWIATNSNSIISVNKDKRYTIPSGAEIEFASITEDINGNMWAGTLGAGVYCFDIKNDTIYRFTSAEGLKSDFCYAIVFDGKESVWIGHRLGVSRVNINRLSVKTYGIENGITGDVNSNSMLANSGEVLIGLTDGVMVYNTQAENTQKRVPLLNLVSVFIDEQPYNPYQPISLSFGRHKVRFEFIGLDYANPEEVIYQYILQGYETEWSQSESTGVIIYPRLEDGEYNLWVRACDNDNCTMETMLFSIKIRKPFWKTWIFVISVILVLASLIYLVIYIRDRNYRKQQEYLERELDARTKEVLEQKDEIELKNRDITDSINYAQRIQFSILPSASILQEYCSDSFIFYRPRDIVSGDFYWFDYIKEREKLVIACADSTGHGVPGAFMSLIGTTVIKDISQRPEIPDPAGMLQALDENIQSILNQNQESEHANDGMDIVACEIDPKTYHVKIASAMRPYIVYQNGKQYVYKGSRASIGGQSVKKKDFAMVELQLEKGDSLYLFSDGYSDQFGGPLGKKLKMSRLQNIIEDVQKRSMTEQYRYIKENFDLWKGNLEQIDDVLMIGIRL